MTTDAVVTGPVDDRSPDHATHPDPAERRPGLAIDRAGRRPDIADRRGWFAVAALTALVAASWVPRLVLPLGDNHAGRIFGRHVLHLMNFRADGLIGSSYTADWSPYTSAPYAHHPPLQNLFDVIFGAAGTDPVLAAQIGPHLMGLLAIPAAAALLRGFRIRWSGTLLAVGLMVVTAFFWLYSPLMFDMAAVLALSAAVLHLRERRDPRPLLVIAACAAALLTTLASWPGIALSAALGLWLFAARRFDRVTLAVAASMILGVAVSLLFVVGVTGVDQLTSQTRMRTAGGEFTALGFLLRQARYASENLPIWYLILLPVAVGVGLANRRTRLYVAVASLFAAGWVIVLNNGSFIHDYWAYPVLIPGLVGMGVLADRLYERLRPRVFTVAAAVAGAVLAAAFAVMILGPIGQDRVYRPADAGALVSTHPPTSGQRFAWSTFSAPRWLSYYWDLPPRAFTEDALREDARPDDLVVVNLRRLPAWLPAAVVPSAIATDGNYGLFRAGDLQRAVGG